MDNEPSEKFWKWFKENQHYLHPKSIKRRDQNKLDDWIVKLKVPAWEVGPYNDTLDLSFFALSPSGNLELYEKIKAIVSLAPAIEGWIFLAAKPPKKWKQKFVWDENKPLIDARNWRFLIYRYDDGLCDIVLIDDVLNDYANDDKRRILDFVILSEIGEIGIMDYVYSIDIDIAVTSNLVKSAVKLEDLKEALQSQKCAE